MDYGHKLTDDELKELEKRISAEYSQAEKEVSEKLADYLSAFARKDEEQKALVEAGEITEKEYLNWRVGQIAIGQRWDALRNNLAEDYHNANKIAKSMTTEQSKDIYALNYNYGVFEVESATDMDTGFVLYDKSTVERLMRDDPQMLPPPGKKVSERIKAGEDVLWNNQQIQSVMMQSLLQGESIGKIANRLAVAVGDSNKVGAIRNARTMTTGAENAGRVDSYKRADEMGIKIKQMWIATIDERTRQSHRELDGQSVEPGETFSNGCEYPGDPKGAPEEVYNCRCTLVAKFPGIPYTFAERGTDKEEYLEWKKGKEEEQAAKSEPVKEPEKVEEVKVEPVEVETVVESIPEPKLVEFTPAKTKADAEEFAMQFAENVNYSGMSLETVNKVNETLANLTNKYPIKELDRISVNKKTSSTAKANYEHLDLNPLYMGKTLIKEAEDFARTQENTQDKINDIIARYNGKKIPSSMQEQIDKLENILKFERYGVLDSYDDKISVLITHEYGHIVADQYFAQINTTNRFGYYESWKYQSTKKSWEEVYNKAYDTGDIYNLSKYGATNSKEFFAECFAAREMGEKLPDYVETLMEEILSGEPL